MILTGAKVAELSAIFAAVLAAFIIASGVTFSNMHNRSDHLLKR